MKKILTTAIFLCLSMGMMAQEALFSSANVQSPVINGDGTVARTAERVIEEFTETLSRR